MRKQRQVRAFRPALWQRQRQIKNLFNAFFKLRRMRGTKEQAVTRQVQLVTQRTVSHRRMRFQRCSLSHASSRMVS